MIETDSLSYLFNFNTEHWINFNFNGQTKRLKYINLSMKEKININNRYEYITDNDERNTAIIQEQCILMLNKAYPNGDINPGKFTTQVLIEIYTKIIEHSTNRKSEIEEFYSKHKTTLIDKSRMNNKPNELNSIISTCAMMSKCNLSLDELSNLDEISLFCLMVFASEESTREMNHYTEMNNKR